MEPPKLIVLRTDPEGAESPLTALVGKGVTFDTGGISLKPAQGYGRHEKRHGLWPPRSLGAMRAIALLKVGSGRDRHSSPQWRICRRAPRSNPGISSKR